MRMHSPRRPGKMVGNMIGELDLTVTDAATNLGVSRQALNNLINNENAAVSPEMALRLETVFGSTVDHWLRMQAAYEAAIIRKKAAKITRGLRRYQPAA